MTTSDSPAPKIGGWQGKNLNDTIGERRPENRGVGGNNAQLSFTGA